MKLFGRNRVLAPAERLAKFGRYQLILPTHLGVKKHEMPLIPSHIKRPDYSNVKAVSEDEPIYLNSTEEIEGIRRACKLAKEMLQLAVANAQAGITTQDLDKLVFDAIIANNAYPSPLGYLGYPKSISTSINNVLCHGIPDQRALVDGDIVNIDITVYLDGFHGDCSHTVAIGNPDQKGLDLINHNEEALNKAIELVEPGRNLKDLGYFISNYAKKHGYSVDRNFCGHGIGRNFHQAPLVYHYPNDYNVTMKPGMVFTIEPIFVQGDSGYVKWPDQWTVVSKDGSRSSQTEHTILVTDNGREILTI